MSDFIPALPKNITWNVGKNKQQDAEKKPQRCTMFIPAESMEALVGHLMRMVDTGTCLTEQEVYNYKTREKEVVPGYYLTGKGIGDSGDGWAKGELTISAIEGQVVPPAPAAVAPPAPPAPPVAPPAPPMPAIPAPSGF